MLTNPKKKPYKKIALVLSLCAIVIWTMLGAGASLAWFTDTTPKIKNVFHIADFDLEVSHRLEDGTYEPIDGRTDIFDDEALYEPGYVQVIYLKIENKGDQAFDFKTAVNITDYTIATNVFDRYFNLQDYLRFGLVTAADENAVMAAVATRDKAESAATMKLNNYSTDVAELDAGQTTYMALIVRMPKEVDNNANYRGTTLPRVELGIIVGATQKTG